MPARRGLRVGKVLGGVKGVGVPFGSRGFGLYVLVNNLIEGYAQCFLYGMNLYFVRLCVAYKRIQKKKQHALCNPNRTMKKHFTQRQSHSLQTLFVFYSTVRKSWFHMKNT